MRVLRQQLIELLDEARQQQGMDEFPKRLQSALVHETLKLLPHPSKPSGKLRIDLRCRFISHGTLHRHLVTIRCPDQAFYLDAIKGYLLRSDIQPLSQQTMVAAMHCDDALCDITLRRPDQQSDDNFMFIALHISATQTPDCTGICQDITAILRAVDLSVRDFHPMQAQLTDIADKLRHDDAGAAELLTWMNEEKYLFFGLRSGKSRLGLMRDYRAMEHVVPGLRAEIESVQQATVPGIEWLHLAACQHYLYSTANVETVRLCWHDADGALAHAILIGHFSRSARHLNASQIPALSRHWHELQQCAILQHSAFYRREIRTLYDRLPKPLLYSIAAKTWLAPLKSIVDMTSATQTSTTHLKPAIGNLEYLLVAMSANRYGPNVLRSIQAAVAAHRILIHGTDSFGVGPYRITVLAIEPGHDSDLSGLADAINDCIIFWKDRAKKVLFSHASEINFPATMKELEALPALYQELFPPTQFLADIKAREYVLASCRTIVRVQQQAEQKGDIELHIITCNIRPLGEMVDKIQAFGLIAIQESVVDFGNHSQPVRISCIRCNAPATLQAGGLTEESLSRLQLGLELVFNDEADHDALNALITATSLDIHQTGILISLRNHLIQLMPGAAPTPLSAMLLRYPAVSERLLHIFAARHLAPTPTGSVQPSERFTAEKEAFEQAMTDVQSLTDDRWFRALAMLIEAGVRTNALVRKTGDPFAFKINPALLAFAPKPRPYREIFVHGTHVEGVHLRAGAVARGGIRYSDRPADFRTEVLDLMSTQVVKNGQIVPTGAKGGFVIRNGSGPAFVLQQYRIFIRTLLEITDNLIHGESIAPDGIRIDESDQNDPYLVVAADKGTARFSDDANAESRLACFWLDDAFASGGSQGYDHKAFGITARGAWVCAAHHFDLLGKDAYNDPLRVIAIGDMGGDVFGNGLLLNPNLQLIGAFNHAHIFLDPNPSAKKAFAERKRLFEASAGWEQYNPKLISNGGGIFQRTAKSIRLSAEVRKALDIESDALSGEALIQALLRAPVDMLYNGGIGTYVKAGYENHHDVQDPANNSVRIDAAQLRATVVCEGGNLGFTQDARIEFARHNGILNTDAIDNSAGVDMSDHEVNLKILFATPALSHTPTTKRNTVLKQVADEVAEQCLNNNLFQSRAVTLAAYDAQTHAPRLTKLRDTLVSDKRLDLQSDPGMDDDDALPLRPQLAVLLGHEKNRIHDALDGEQFSARSCFADELLRGYFPESLGRRFSTAMQEHPLAAGIVHTQAANHVVNRIGLTSLHHLQSLLGQSVSSVVQALLLAEALLEITYLREAIWQSVTDKAAAIHMQWEMREQVMHFAEELLRLTPVHQLDMQWIQTQKSGLNHFRHSLAAQGVGGAENSRYLELLKSASQAGVSTREAAHLAAMPELTQMATAVHISSTEKIPLTQCLKATQVCIHLLPLHALESALRSPAWAGPDAHELRKEWLHRLTLLKLRATQQLLQPHPHSLQEAGKERWGQHKHWQHLQAAGESIAAESGDLPASETARLRLILSLTHLESLIDES